jgi:prevent-host-death family protein
METASISEVKNGLSAIIDRVKGGESIVVTDRGIPVAVIEPVTHLDLEDRLARLERAGLVTRAKGVLSDDFFTMSGPKLPDGIDLVDYIVEERRTGR